MKKTLSKVLVLMLVLCMVLPQTVFAATYNYLEVSIEELDGDPKVSTESAKYLQDNEPLAALIYTAINTKYAELDVFNNGTMKAIMDAGIQAYQDEVTNGNAGAWTNWVNGYFSAVTGGTNDLKTPAASLTSVISDLTVDAAYTMQYDNYLVTATRKQHSTGGGGGGVYIPSTPVTPEHVCPSEHLVDVDQSLWYHEAIDYVVENDIMIGITEETFEPETKLTRGMMMTMIARMDGVDTTGGEKWYTKGMEWAVANGVSDGTNPEATITRSQLVTMLYRYAELKGKDVSAASDLAAFADAENVSDWALTAVKWAVGTEVMKGVSATELDPQGAATRAQTAQFILNFQNLVLSK